MAINRLDNKMPLAVTEPRSYPSSLEQRLTNPLEAAGVKSGGNQTQLYLSQREPARLQGWMGLNKRRISQGYSI